MFESRQSILDSLHYDARIRSVHSFESTLNNSHLWETETDVLRTAFISAAYYVAKERFPGRVMRLHISLKDDQNRLRRIAGSTPVTRL